MPNRRSSAWIQVGTALVLGAAWTLARRRRRAAVIPEKADGRYNINAASAGILSAALLLADLYAIPAVLRGKPDMDRDELGQVDSGLVHWIDRHALSFSGERRDHYRKISDRLLQGLTLLPVGLLLNREIRKDWQRVTALYAWTHALTYTIYSFSPLGPAFVDKYRPVVYYRDLPEAVRNLGNNRNARFSGHTANGACATFFLAKVFNDYHPESTAPESGLRYLLAFAAPLLLGWLRMKSLKHFPSDVLQAILIGGACGVAIPELYRNAD